MKIVTGHTGTPHITANDDQGLNQGIFGTGSYMLNVGQQFAATLVDAMTVSIADGEGVMQGVHFRIDPGTSESVAISSGIVGYNRRDLICARYTKDISTGFEAVNLVVIEGTPTTGAVSDPEYNTGDILTGDTIVDFPLWRVTLSGLTPSLSRAGYRMRTVSSLADCDSQFSDIYNMFSEIDVSTVFSTTNQAGPRIEATFTLSKGIFVIFVNGLFTASNASAANMTVTCRGETIINRAASFANGYETPGFDLNASAVIQTSQASNTVSFAADFGNGTNTICDATIKVLRLKRLS